MRDNIISKLKDIENKYSIKILYACEAGSRTWGLHSEDSDYDVRFIYVHSPSYYLSIDPVGIGKKKDVLEFPIHHSLDLQGFELTKALRLFRKSNPNLLEWLHSNMIYYQAFHTIDHLLEVESDIFQTKACIHHYMNMAKRNFRKVEEQKSKEAKNYIQVIRPILICKWIRTYQTFPDLNMDTLLKETKLPRSTQEEIQLLFDAKKKQLDFQPEHLYSFAKRELKEMEGARKEITVKQTEAITEKLNDIFRKTLAECWS